MVGIILAVMDAASIFAPLLFMLASQKSQKAIP